MKAMAVRFTTNPVLRRELLERWRGRRASGVITAYVGLLAVFTLLLAWIGVRTIESNAFDGTGFTGSGPMLGRFLLENLLAVTMGLAMLLAPAYAATQISGERERQTLSLLRITLVKPGQIVIGKLGASVAWLLLLVLAAIPLTAIGFFLGGVTLGQLGRGVFTLLAMTVSVAAMGIGISSVTKRSTPALVVTILLVGVITIGTLFAGLVEGAVRRFDFGPDGRPVTTLVNPFVGLADAVGAQQDYRFGNVNLPSVLSAFGELLPRDQQNIFGEDMIMMERGFAAGGFDGDIAFAEPVPGGLIVPDFAPDVVEIDDGDHSRTPYWLYTSLLYLALGGLFLALAARRVAREGAD